ncbi:MAG: hypothetical protein U9M92_00300 [Patescibacteria group bacterium]|nr:hypothetical protein [Patescibacteria group bacterium]
MATNTTNTVDTERVVIAGEPGNYNLTVSDGQMVMETYEVIGLKAADRVNIARNFNTMLEADGRGGSTSVASIKRGKEEIVLLVVTATPDMQASIAQTIEKVNSGEITFFGNLPATEVYRPTYRPAAAIAAAVRPELTSMGMLHVDEVANILTIEDDPTIVPFLMTIVAKYDQPSPREIVEVTIVEMYNGDGSDIGTDWNAWIRTLPTSISASFGGSRSILSGAGGFDTGITTSDTSCVTGGLSLSGDKLSQLRPSSFSVVASGISPQALAGFINYMVEQGRCRVNQKADVAIMNGKSSTLAWAIEAPRRATLTAEDGTRTLGEAQVVEGITLTLSGNIAKAGARINIEADSTSVVGYGQTGLPVLMRSSVDTSVVAPSGKTVVVSGLKRTRQVTVTREDPFLGKLDVLHLFSREVKENKEVDVYICVSLKQGDQISPAKEIQK